MKRSKNIRSDKAVQEIIFKQNMKNNLPSLAIYGKINIRDMLYKIFLALYIALKGQRPEGGADNYEPIRISLSCKCKNRR